MLKIDKQQLEQLEQAYPGITKQILHFEEATFPVCDHCGSKNTAGVQVGVIGRTINIAAATDKFQLVPNEVHGD